ncbi:carbon-nitrogen hydrolase family protein [Pseudomonas maumuensis]|uniref:Carbon-nitrogen hydrolase family protein n=1 Tax=Pseudomonas maumuensis TaxID=2842354 RepID=A0ABX8NIF4_9PSED|nr:carbon-nitrogen hydrolase family protein [Pseudomonas maumuensis]QXH55943.1 carbon-nitrogen hydrolase family protein [Pseudomonas maumuensis]
MPNAVFAAAQCSIHDGDIPANLALHLAFMRQAHEHGVGLLLFPELSLTGYALSVASGLAQELDTPLLAPLRQFAQEAGMTTVVGMPLKVPGQHKPRIAACILHPDGSIAAYTKQHLHTGEDAFFDAGSGGELLSFAGLSVALSVCADFTHPEHAAEAAQRGAQVYATGVLIGEGGYPTDSALLQGHAQRHAMAVLMANHGGSTGGWAAAGRSAFWDEQGRCVAASSGVGNRLLVVTGQAGDWQGLEVLLSHHSG